MANVLDINRASVVWDNEGSMTEELDQHLIAGWLAAANDLGIRIVAPYSLAGPDKPSLCEVFLPDFGSPAGALFVSARTERRIRSVLESSGLWTAIELDGPEMSYDLRGYISTLRDFGWFGSPNDKPRWWAEGLQP